jgi:phosphoribosylaminoimidazolecarboxamide formyltransferase / IMP cyclohydrolase
MIQWRWFTNLISSFVKFLQDNCMLGMGSGQPNRVESLRIAMRKAGAAVKGAALASDAFFPFGKC